MRGCSHVFDVDQFVADCQSALAEDRPTLAIKEVLERTMSSAREVVAALGEPDVSDITVLYSGDDLTVLNAVWAPCMNLYPHNHNMAAAIGIYGGQEDNTFWRRAPGGLERAGVKELHARDVEVLGPDVIHSVSNPRRAYTAAIHVYLGDYLNAERSEWDPLTFEERPFSLENSRREFARAEAEWNAVRLP